jgi:TolA-binding protein
MKGQYRRLIRFILAAFSFAIASCAISASVYSIQIGAYPNSIQALLAQQAFALNGYPAAILQDSSNRSYPWKLCTGKFNSYAEAFAYKTKVREKTAPDCFILTLPDSTTGLASGKLPVKRPFITTGLDQPDPANAQQMMDAGGFGKVATVDPGVESKDVTVMSADELLAVGQEATIKPVIAVPALQRFLAVAPGSPQAGRAKVQLARVLGRGQDLSQAERLLNEAASSGNDIDAKNSQFVLAHLRLNQKNFSDAKARFLAIANDKSFPKFYRRQSMKSVAQLYHKDADRANAYLAFQQILDTAETSATAADAKRELIGLAYEQVLCEKGNWDEVRGLADAFIASDAPHDIKATVALMKLETYYEESLKLTSSPQQMNEKLFAALDSVHEFIKNYPDVTREYLLARNWEGLFLLRLGYINEAKASFELVMTFAAGPQDQFANLNPRASAAVWLAYIAKVQGDSTAMQNYITLVKNEFPGSRQAHTADILSVN